MATIQELFDAHRAEGGKPEELKIREDSFASNEWFCPHFFDTHNRVWTGQAASGEAIAYQDIPPDDWHIWHEPAASTVKRAQYLYRLKGRAPCTTERWYADDEEFKYAISGNAIPLLWFERLEEREFDE